MCSSIHCAHLYERGYLMFQDGAQAELHKGLRLGESQRAQARAEAADCRRGRFNALDTEGVVLSISIISPHLRRVYIGYHISD